MAEGTKSGASPLWRGNQVVAIVEFEIDPDSATGWITGAPAGLPSTRGHEIEDADGIRWKIEARPGADSVSSARVEVIVKRSSRRQRKD